MDFKMIYTSQRLQQLFGITYQWWIIRVPGFQYTFPLILSRMNHAIQDQYQRQQINETERECALNLLKATIFLSSTMEEKYRENLLLAE